jgi:nicotinamidase-related amidase
MDSLDPSRTALLVVHMVKGAAGQVDTPFNRLFRQRAEKAGIIRTQARLLDGFRSAKAKVIYTLVA